MSRDGYPNPCPRITGATVRIIESEGLGAALNAVASALEHGAANESDEELEGRVNQVAVRWPALWRLGATDLIDALEAAAKRKL